MAPGIDADLVRGTARRASADPMPDVPPTSGTTPWIAAPGQIELARLHRLVREGFAVCKEVGYPPGYGAIEPVVRFRAPAPATPLRATGEVEIATGEGTEVRIETDGVAPAAFTVDGDPHGWESSIDGITWEPARVHLGTSAVAPHALREPVVPIPMARVDDLFELPSPLLGRVVLRCVGTPSIVAGESREEARAPDADGEQRHDLEQRDDGAWASVHELGLRFLRVDGVDEVRVEVEASVHPVPRRGAFACSDDRLTGIWAVSAATLRLCMHDLMLDGVKRDRMPWIGDQAIATAANAYAFADAAIVADSLVALGANRTGYVNGIADYSLWWVVTTGFFARCFDAREHLAREAVRIDRFVARIAADADEDGLFRPVLGDDAFEKPVFIDWGVDVDPDRISTALQLLWFWALQEAVHVLRAAGLAAAATRWEALAERLRTTLLARAWDRDSDSWREYLDDGEPGSPYPNLFAVLSGIHRDGVPTGVAGVLAAGPQVGTPFMAAFLLRATAAIGRPELAVERLRALWGPMLDAGARTFWEEFDAPDRSAMYGRPFGKSLCHAWGAGPAALLPEIVCGVRPVEDGWRRFVVEPALGALDWAGAVVPVPGGDIEVVVEGSSIAVRVPPGHALVRDGVVHEGPAEVRW